MASPSTSHSSSLSRKPVASRMDMSPRKQIQVRVRNLAVSASMRVSKSSDGATHHVETLSSAAITTLRRLVPHNQQPQREQRPILRKMNGVFAPGTMTLVLGQPSSGKSTLLKALGGRLSQSTSMVLDGEISYNGVAQISLHSRLPQLISYAPQRDLHLPTLIVRETLVFAHECCGGEHSTPDENRFALGTAEEEKCELFHQSPAIVATQLGLTHCQDTIIGDASMRGVSGGERKRVTMGEMEFGNKVVALMDEISTGLDSAATLDIITTQRRMARQLGKTVVMALLQPSPEVVALFDDLVLLNDGYVMYSGPRGQVLGYFASLGFVCPVGRDDADFLMDLGTEQQAQYVVPGANPPRTPSEFAAAYEASAIHAAVLAKLNTPVDSEGVDNVPEFHQFFWASVWTLTRRETTSLMRNTPLLQGRSTVLLLVAFVYSTVFYQVDMTRIQSVVGLLFMSILFLAWNQSAQLPVLMAGREIFYKQRGANFYRSSAYVLGVSLSQVPLAVAEAVTLGAIVYWVSGFVQDVGAFLLFEMLLILTNLAFFSWFFLLAAVAPNMHVGEPLSILSTLVFIIFAGFIVTEDNIPDYFAWAYWFNPIAWCLRALLVDQYQRAPFTVCELDGVAYCDEFGVQAGEYLLSVYQMPSDRAWFWYGAVFMVASYTLYMALTAVVLEYVRYEGPVHGSVKSSDPVATGVEEGGYQLATTPRAVDVRVDIARASRPCPPVTLAFKNLRYWVPNPAKSNDSLALLKGVSGFAKPGTITALMGSSGAGKTTLMDVIAGRKTGGKMEGEILLNGHPATDLAIRRSTGYCEQTDVHAEQATFQEALLFSAFLRQDAGVSTEAKHATVDEVLDLLGLRPIADQVVHGSSMEQMKRLTIGVELAAQPSVLFLDEPTSGLDARAAKLIMDGVRNVADSGRTVVCTIHQPSWEVFNVFDNLLLLKKGGETVFFGELGANACELVKYFESIPSVAALPSGYNPATWMLEVIGAGVDHSASDQHDTDFVAIFKQSTKATALERSLVEPGVGCPLPGSFAIAYKSKRAASAWTQATWLLSRAFAMQWRSVDYNMSRFVVYVLLALTFGLVFVVADYTTYQGVNAGAGMISETSIFVGFTTLQSVLATVGHQQPVFYRERSAQTYSVVWYLVAVVVSELPYVGSSSLLFCSVLFPLVGFTGLWRFVLYWIHTSLHVVMQMSIGIALAFLFPSVEVAMVVGVLANAVFFLFLGFNPTADAIPTAYKWLYHITPHQYTFAILTSLVFGECSSANDELGCQPVGGVLPPTLPPNTLIKNYVADVFRADIDDVWTNTAFILGSIAFFCMVSLLALRFLNHQRR